MKPLTHREVRALLAGVSALYADPDPASLPARILKSMTEVSSAEITGIDSFHPRGHWLNQTWQEPAQAATPEEMQVFGHYAHEHPLFRAFLQTGLPIPHKTSDYLSARQFQRLGIYNEFFRRIGVDRQILFGLPVSPDLTLVLSLNRSKKDFTETDRRLLAALRPHMLNAWKSAAALAKLQLQHLQLQFALAEAGCGVVVLSLDGRAQLVTAQARALLAKYFATPRGSAEAIPDELMRWLTHCTRGPSNDGIPPAPVPLLEVVNAGARLGVRLLIDNRSEQVMLLLEEQVAASAESLKTLGLTKREAEVLSWVAQGKKNSEIAVLCDISARTVQKHLEHIYQKLGVESRTAATRLALSTLKRLN